MIQFVFFHTSLFPIDAGILALLTNADNPFSFCRYHLFNKIQDVTRGLVAPSLDVSPCSYWLFCWSRCLLTSLYSSADICILGSTVPVSLDLTDVRTLVFPLSSLASTMF